VSYEVEAYEAEGEGELVAAQTDPGELGENSGKSARSWAIQLMCMGRSYMHMKTKD
jgi:hypothetical protein